MNEEFQLLYETYSKEIYRFLLKLVGYREDLAEELTQETFYQTFLSLHRYRGDCDIKSVFIFVFSLIFNTSIIRGGDMEPTYGFNATVLVNKIAYLFYGPKNNDIVVFTIQNDTWIKRVIAGPGDTVYYESGYLLVNGTSKDTAQWCGKTTNVGDQSYPLTITKDEYFVIGDSLDNSYDSRYEGCGTIKRSQITGKVLCQWLSLNSLFTQTTVATSSIPTN